MLQIVLCHFIVSAWVGPSDKEYIEWSGDIFTYYEVGGLALIDGTVKGYIYQIKKTDHKFVAFIKDTFSYPKGVIFLHRSCSLSSSKNDKRYFIFIFNEYLRSHRNITVLIQLIIKKCRIARRHNSVHLQYWIIFANSERFKYQYSQ